MNMNTITLLLVGVLLLHFLLDVTPGHAQSIEDLKKGVVKITAQTKDMTMVGTGFIVRLEKDTVYVVTAAHVLGSDPQPKVEFFTKPSPVRATVVNKEGEEVTSLALLMIQGRDSFPSGVTALPIAAAVRLSGGEDIVVIGHPRSAGDWTVLKGSIARRDGRHVKVDANVDEGSSGGPMLQNGKVVGLVAGTTKYGLAVTASSIRDYLDGNRVPLEEDRGTAQITSPSGSPTKSETREPTRDREITGKDGAPMVLVPAREFMMGSRQDDKSAENDERPAHSVYLDAYYIDQYEVTTTRYATFFRATNRRQPTYWSEQLLQQHGNKPVVGVDWNDASAYCAWAGKRLPTEAEWEKAARGTDQRPYPWGNATPNKTLANFERGFDFKDYGVLTDVGSFEEGKSPYGAYDMAGNVWEWVSDWYDEHYYSKSPARNPKGPSSGEYRVIRGGSWSDGPVLVRSAYRSRITPTNRLVYLGFRCAQDIPK